MGNMEKKLDKLWVGVFSATNALIVYDPIFQRENDEYIYIYSVLGNRVRRMRRGDVRRQVRAAIGKERSAAIEKYSRWSQEGGTYDEVHAAAGMALDKARDLHRKIIEDAGLPYLGVRGIQARAHRTSHCWACKDPLDSEIALECVACKWMLCKCGACGCTYVQPVN